MTEKEKMLAGELYDAYAPLLTKERKIARQLAIDYNRTSEDEVEKRQKILSELLGSFKENITIEPSFKCDYGYNIHVGENFFANFDCTILDVGEVRIGDNCFMGPNVSIYTPVHPLIAVERNIRTQNGKKALIEYAKPVTIGDNVWFGGSVVINPGVTIGDNVVIGSGSVVTKDIPSNTIAAGNPCRIIREITEKDSLE